MSDDDSSQEGAGGMPSDVILGGDEVAVENDNDDIINDKSGSSTRTSSHRSTALKKSSRKSSSSRTRPVVKLLVTSVSRSYSEPWRRRHQREASGTGFLVRWGGGGGGGSSNDNNNSIRIVTNAHVVRNASTVRARASFGPHVVNCEVEWLSLPLDLALLKITTADWDDFRKGWGISDSSSSGLADATVAPDGESAQITKQDADSICLTLSSGLPRLDENVTCVGFPTGGTQISVTRGVVSRIDVDSHSVMRLQIDAAINPGNSGGPVFDENGQVVGVASAHLRGAGNIGYIIPSKIVDVFMKMCTDGIEVDVEDKFCGLGSLVVGYDNPGGVMGPKHVPGIPNLATVGSQSLESKALRRHLGLVELDLDGGIRIVGATGTDVKLENEDDKTDANNSHRLNCDDVLLAINGCSIGMDGTIQLSPSRPDERINYRSLVTCQRVGSKVTLDVLRKKQRQEFDVVLDQSRFLVSQYDDFDAIPLYVVVGGCVFSPLTLPLVQENNKKTPSSFSKYYMDQRVGHEQLLVLSKVLNDDVNVGYHGWKNLILKSVNGYEPTNIQDLVNALRKLNSEMIEFRCQVVGQNDADYVICMDLNEVLSSEQRVLKQHMIASWCSTEALSKELRDEVEKYEPVEAKRIVSWNTMKGLRNILDKKEVE
jgi:S1-C subfamily serine protease